MQTTMTNPAPVVDQDPQQVERVERAIRSKSFAVVSSVSEAGFPHAAGIVYDSVGVSLYVHTMRSSRKVRNITTNPRLGVVIPVRRLPVGPPFTVQFQATAQVLAMDDPEITRLIAEGELKNISGHGALEEPDGCFLRIEPTGRIHTYGIGVSTIGLIRDPLHAGARSVALS